MLIDLLSKHFKPTPLEIVGQCKFHSHFHKPGESVATFIAELRSLSEFYNFSDTFKVMIRDRGINDDAIQKRLLSEPNLTYAKSVDIVQNMEMVVQDVKELKTKPEHPNTLQSRSVPDVNKVVDSPGTTKKSRLPVITMERRGHTAPSCRVSRLIVCHQCGKRYRGHARVSPRILGQSRLGDTDKCAECRTKRMERSLMHHVRLHGSIKSPPILVKLTVAGDRYQVPLCQSFLMQPFKCCDLGVT